MTNTLAWIFLPTASAYFTYVSWMLSKNEKLKDIINMIKNAF